MMNHSQDYQIGGPGHTVEIGESMFGELLPQSMFVGHIGFHVYHHCYDHFHHHVLQHCHSYQQINFHDLLSC